MRPKGVLRKQVLIPGTVLEQFGGEGGPGKHHGSVIRVDQNGGEPVAYVRMTDLKDLKVKVPVEKVRQYVIETEAQVPRPKKLKIESQLSRWKQPIVPPSMPVTGEELIDFIKKMDSETPPVAYPIGTKVWVNLRARGHWPGLIWAIRHCRKDDLADIMLVKKPDRVLVKFYGEHSHQWVQSKQIIPSQGDDSDLVKNLEAWGRKNRNIGLVRLALLEMNGAEEDLDAEIARVCTLYEMHTSVNKRMQKICHSCNAPQALLKCTGCERRFHSLCLRSPSLTIKHLPNSSWECPCCSLQQRITSEDVVTGNPEEADAIEQSERMGLTPDWIISAAAFKVFNLQQPTVSCPKIYKLLDPCTNSKIAPNIPAEKLYDKADNGLKVSNSWSGYYVILNPDYSSQIQWRFVNRAIDEVENGNVPGIILICRNSTDTAFYQRLRPYPRVHLKRLAILFKDYSNTPIGFGISIFCLAKDDRKSLYPRFYEHFGDHGEPNIPVDVQFALTDQFWSLLDRLAAFTDNHHRDHWIKCSLCEKWRIVPWATVRHIGDTEEWDCSMLSPPNSSCSTPASKLESIGGHYATRDQEVEIQDKTPNDSYVDPTIHVVELSATTNSQKARQHNPKEKGKSAISSRIHSMVSEIQQHDSMQQQVSQELLVAQNSELRHTSALELARKARMAANRAYLIELGDSYGEMINNCEHDAAVSIAARKLAAHVAKKTCAIEIEKAYLQYQKADFLLRQQEEPLKSALKSLQDARRMSKQNLEAAQAASKLIEKELCS